MSKGKASQHWWHNEQVKKAKRNDPEKYAQYLLEDEQKRKAAAARKLAQPTQQTPQKSPISLEKRKAEATRIYTAHMRAAIHQIGKDAIDPEQELNNAEIRDFVSKSFDKYSVPLFKLLRAAELGSNYNPGGLVIRDMVNDISAELNGRIFAVQIIRYHIAAEMQRVIKDSAEEDEQLKQAVESLRNRKRVPLMSDLNFDLAYTLWSRAGSWLGAMEFAGLDFNKPKVVDEKAIEYYRATHASPDLLTETVRKRLAPETMERLSLICKMTNQIGRYIVN